MLPKNCSNVCDPIQMHRLAPTFRSCFRCAIRPWISSSTVLTRRAGTLSGQGRPTETADVIEEPDGIADLEPESMGEEDSETPRSYQTFMNKIGYQYRFASPQNWLGRNVVNRLVVFFFSYVDSFLVCPALPHESLL